MSEGRTVLAANNDKQLVRFILQDLILQLFLPPQDRQHSSLYLAYSREKNALMKILYHHVTSLMYTEGRSCQRERKQEICHLSLDGDTLDNILTLPKQQIIAASLTVLSSDSFMHKDQS